MLVPHDLTLDPFAGVCSYHDDCLEGLASGPAMKQRWGQPAETLPADHPGWELEARYLALAVSNLVLCHSPRRIVLGGGVMQQPGLIEMVRAETVDILNGYIRSPEILERIDSYLVLPALGNRAGVLGAIALAMDSLDGHVL
jgi:fructokinase